MINDAKLILANNNALNSLKFRILCHVCLHTHTYTQRQVLGNLVFWPNGKNLPEGCLTNICWLIDRAAERRALGQCVLCQNTKVHCWVHFYYQDILSYWTDWELSTSQALRLRKKLRALPFTPVFTLNSWVEPSVRKQSPAVGGPGLLLNTARYITFDSSLRLLLQLPGTHCAHFQEEKQKLSWRKKVL